MSEPNPAHGQITDLFSKSHASNEKFDYFICGVAGALFAYIGQSFSPENMPQSACIVLFLSLVALSIAFFCGCRRIQTQTMVVRSNQHIIEKEELIKTMLARLKELEPHEKAGKTVTIHNDIGDASFTMDEFRKMKDQRFVELAELKGLMDYDRRNYIRYGFIRDWSLIVGFVFVLASKILQIFPIN